MSFLFSFLALTSFIAGIVFLIGTALYYLDNWLDQDETTERVTTARHRA